MPHTTSANNITLKYDDYVKERELLTKFEQACYDGYERTILTLSSAFLVFSISFLGLLRSKLAAPNVAMPLNSVNLILYSWVFFASSVFVMLCNFMISALGLRAGVKDLESRLDGESTNKVKKWTIVSFALYFFSGSSFIIGVIFLIRFCARNLSNI